MSEATSELRTALVTLILEITAQDGVDPSGFDDAAVCVGGELLHDSLDVLEFLVAIDRTYGVSVRDGAVGHTMLTDLGTLTAYVAEHRTR